MRDVERLREKIQISLEDRQVWALGFSAILLLAGVFMAGMLVGRRTAPLPAPASGDLTALDEAAVPPRAKPAPPPKVEQIAEKTTEKSVETAPAEPKPAPEKAAEEKAADPKPAEKHEAAQARAAPTVVAPPKPAMVVPPAPRPVAVSSPVQAVLAPPPRDLGAFTVQIGASQDRADAQRLESRARAAGLKPYVVEVNLGAKGTWYRVRVGSFKDKDAAARYRKDVERELRGTAVVMPTH